MGQLPTVLEEFLAPKRLKHIPRGQIILYEGDIPPEIYVLKSGAVKIYDIDDQGNEKILHIVKAPAVVPFAFFSGLTDPLKWFYAALTDCDIYVIPARDALEQMSKNIELANLLTHNFSYDVHELLVRLSSLSKTNTRDKLTAALKFLIVCHATERRSGWWRVNFPASHQLLADLSGVTRESIALVMKEFQNEKIVRNPRLTILEINRDNLLGEK